MRSEFAQFLATCSRRWPSGNGLEPKKKEFREDANRGYSGSEPEDLTEIPVKNSPISWDAIRAEGLRGVRSNKRRPIS
jgi:hypothetical protein